MLRAAIWLGWVGHRHSARSTLIAWRTSHLYCHLTTELLSSARESFTVWWEDFRRRAHCTSCTQWNAPTTTKEQNNHWIKESDATDGSKPSQLISSVSHLMLKGNSSWCYGKWWLTREENDIPANKIQLCLTKKKKRWEKEHSILATLVGSVQSVRLYFTLDQRVHWESGADLGHD